MIGYIDESVRGTASGLMYVVASAILIEGNDDEARDKLRKLRLPDQQYLHWREESAARRNKLLAEVLQLGVLVYAVAAHPVAARRQEKARARTLLHLLYLLGRREGVRDVVIESRHPLLNRRDATVISQARQHGTLPAAMRYQHMRKSEEPLLWAADIVVSALSADLTTRERPYYLALQPAILNVEQIGP